MIIAGNHSAGSDATVYSRISLQENEAAAVKDIIVSDTNTIYALMDSAVSITFTTITASHDIPTVHHWDRLKLSVKDDFK